MLHLLPLAWLWSLCSLLFSLGATVISVPCLVLLFSLSLLHLRSSVS